MSQIAPDSSNQFPGRSSGEGNTHSPSPRVKKPQPPSRKNHFFTYYPDSSINRSSFDKIIQELKLFAYKGKVQSEICPTSKRLHLQGMIWCKAKHRDTEFKLLKGAHFEALKDIDNVADYCGKEETHDGQFRAEWGFPEPPFVQEIENFYEWEEHILELFRGSPDDRTIHWFWEPEGCAGKTTFEKYIFTHYDKVVVLSGKASDMKNGVVTYFNTNKYLPRIILINIPRSSTEFVSYTGLEELKDMFFYSGKYEGGMVCGRPPFLLVFANEEPEYSKMSSDRFVVKDLTVNPKV